ncbi:MAG: isocitrate/isopropylmalate dehydrogenase family protein [Planctomycetes bacterium]|nr:isocitrate/isopropylmalate dehydrogenase family protein [Planctomycetota bacterium]
MTTQSFHIAVLPGDGIGPEVMAEAERVLKAALSGVPAIRLELQELPAGAAEYLRHGDPLPHETMAACAKADAILLGAMGLPDVRWPDGREMAPQLDLRERLDLYAGLRPIRLYHTADTPLKRYQAGEIDLLIVRENTEGLFSSRLARTPPGATTVEDILRISRARSERLFRAAFKEAQRRRRHVTLVDKSNVLPSMVFFRSVFDEVAKEFSDVQSQRTYIDATALYLVQRPETFDVIVTENMFGDILSDLAAGLVGGMGLAPSADIGDGAAVFQPSHGTAPDIAGCGIANPIAMILSAAMMLEWFDHPGSFAAANRIRHAVAAVLADESLRTPDLGGQLTTRGMGDAVLECVGKARGCPKIAT